MHSPRCFAPLATSIATLLIAATASAASLNWDADGVLGGPLGGAGTWTVAGQNWTDGVTQQAWSNAANNVAVFGGDTAGTVTLAVPVIVGGLAFETPGYVLTGQTIHLGVVGGNTITVNADATIHSLLAGDSTAALTISGSGTLTLTGLNTYAGPTSIQGTTIVLNNFGDAAGGNLGTTGQISLSGGVLRYTGASFSTARAIAIGGALGGGTLEVTDAATTVTLAGSVSGAASQLLSKTGEGTLVLEGTTDNSGGRVTLDGGTLVLAKTSTGSVHSVGSPGGSDYALVINDGLAQLAGTGGDQIYFQSSVLMNGGTFDMNGRSEGFSQLNGSAGVVTNSATDTTSTLTLGDNNGTAEFDGAIKDGEGVLALTKMGSGTLTLGGVNTYSGGTTINGGILLANTLASLPGYQTAGKVVVNSGGTVAVRVGGMGEWQEADLQALRASATFNAGAGFGIDTTSGDYTYGGMLSGDLSFIKLGDHTLLLTGANSHTAGTRVEAGTLKLGSATAFGAGPATITGGTLDVNGFSIATPMLSGAGEVINSSTTDATITIDLGASAAGAFAGILSTPSTGKLHLVFNATAGGTASNYSLNSFNTFVGSVTVNGVGDTAGTKGVLGIAQGGGLGDSSNVLTLHNGGTLTNMSNPATGGGWPNYAAPVLDNPIVLTGAAGGVFRAGYASSGGGLTLNGVISGPGSFTKTDGGFVELTADNTYEGTTTIAAGTLRLGNGGTTGSIPAASLLTFGAGNDNRLEFNREGATVFPNPIDKGGRANITVHAEQTVTLTGRISGTGEFWISGPGTMIVPPNANTTGSGSIVLKQGITLEISDFSTQTFGSGNFFLAQGPSDSTLRYTGPSVSTTRLQGGAFQGTSATLDVTDPNTTLTLTAALTVHNSNSGPTYKTGPGTLALTGANSWGGGAVVDEGRLLVNNTSGSGTGTGPVTVLEGAILGGTGTIVPTGSNGLDVQGIIAPGNGIGTLTFDLTNTTGIVMLSETAAFHFELGVAGSVDFPGTSDRITITGASEGDFMFAGNVIDFGATGAEGWYRLFNTGLASTWAGLSMNGDNVITGGLSVANLAPGLSGDLILGNGTVGAEGQIYLHVVPEPGSAALLLGAAGALLGFRRRRSA